MDFVKWVGEFEIMRDGDYLGFSATVEEEEHEPMRFCPNLVKDTDYIYDVMISDQSLVWSAHEEDGKVIITNGFDNFAVWYYIAAVQCKKKTLKVLAP